MVALNNRIPWFCLSVSYLPWGQTQVVDSKTCDEDIFYFLSFPMIRLCTGYPLHNNQTRTGSLFARPRCKSRINKSVKTRKAPGYSYTTTKKFWRSFFKTWLSVRCVHGNPEPQTQNCLLYQLMWWSDFTTLKDNPKADLSNGFYCGKFIFSAQLIKLNHFFFFSIRPYQRIEDGPKTLPHTSSVRRIISRWMLS